MIFCVSLECAEGKGSACYLALLYTILARWLCPYPSFKKMVLSARKSAVKFKNTLGLRLLG
jgi:hypothetical protein